MSFLRVLRVMFSTARSLNAKSRAATALAKLPMPALVSEWGKQINRPDVFNGSLRSPSRGGIEAAEARLGFALPDQLREFYLACDGIEAADEAHPHPFVRAVELEPA